MALLDHSFHDFDINLWVNNFIDLPEPEYILQTLDDLDLTPECDELRSIFKKDGTYDKIVGVLEGQDMEHLFFWSLKPDAFIADTGIQSSDPNYIKFLSEFIPGFILYRNQWDRNQLGIEIREFVKNANQPYVGRPTRLKKCTACGYNITDLFAVNLTADNILDDTPVAVTCPHCNVVNYIKYEGLK